MVRNYTTIRDFQSVLRTLSGDQDILLDKNPVHLGFRLRNKTFNIEKLKGSGLLYL